MSFTSTPVHGDKPTIASPTGVRDFKELSAAAFARTRMPMVLADARQADCPIVLANQAFLDLTGYSAKEVVGQNCRFLQGAETSQSDVDQLRTAIAAGRGVDVELLNYRKDGSQFWNQLHLSPILDDNGELAYFFASQIDVTEFRKVQSLEAAEHRLLMEVDHRTKNALAIVDSIVRLSNSSDPVTYAAAVQRRVHSLARAHELLSKGGWKPVEISAVVEAQLGRDGNSSIETEGPAILVEVELVQPLSLVLHELHANALFHGSLSLQGTGKLLVDWRTIQEGGFAIRWRELAVRSGSPRPKKGFGTVIAQALVEKQMGGTIDRRWKDDGLVVEIAIPARKAIPGSRFG